MRTCSTFLPASVLSAALLALPASIMSTPAAAAPHVVCLNYANTAVAQNQRNVNRGCGYSGPRWTFNWQGHYNWCRAVSFGAQQSEINIRRNRLIACAGGGGGGPITRTFNNPRIGGLLLDWCRRWGRECGGPAATAYCRRRGYRFAVSWRQAVDVGRWTSTRIISSGRVCSANFCDSFQWIRCRR